ncbi:unnamed protein product [Nippostrongylus brasiliensis]|uniref:Glycosyltransferase family 92 protein n=1 Tax=Nippostrongylus brasiliensis TaxID=27835 RepID=A0A158QWY4_NIPBR|nr:unnamed protein product [Nippostrongylus brasiliensis]
MGSVASRFCVFVEILFPPRLHLRLENSRVKNMLPSYTQIPSDISDSESLGSQREGGNSDAKDDENVEDTIRIHLKDDNPENNTVDNVSQCDLGPSLEKNDHEKINACLPFYELLDIHAKIIDDRYTEYNGSISLIAAYAFPDYSVITFETKDWKGQKVYCWYLDEEKRLVGLPVETRVEPHYTAYSPKYQLSHCLSPLHGNGPKWLLFTEFVEHYKLIGVEYFYVYVKDIDEYSARVLNDYVKTGEIETTFLRTNDRPGGTYLHATIQDCIHRSRHHSRYVIIGDLDERIVLSGTGTLTDYVTKFIALHPNVSALRFRSRYALRSQDLPLYYYGEETLKKHLPTLVYHNTTPIEPNFGGKSVVDPAAVMSMSLHEPKLYFRNYNTFYVPVADAFIRHIRYPDESWIERRLRAILMYGKTEKTYYPGHLMPVLYRRVKERLDRVYLMNQTIMKHKFYGRYISHWSALLSLMGLHFLAGFVDQQTVTMELQPENINTCLPFHELLDIHGKVVEKDYVKLSGFVSLIAAYAFPNYSAITFETKHWKGQKAYCWYLDEEKRLVGPPVETVIEPRKFMALHPNVSALRFRSRSALRSGNLPLYYHGEETLKKHLPTLVYHNTTPTDSSFGAKSIVDPTAVMAMSVHEPTLYLRNYDTFYVPVADAFIRHVRYPDESWIERRLRAILMYGKMEKTYYPAHLMPILYQRVKERLDRVYL